MDFEISAQLDDLKRRTRDFVVNAIIPYERDARQFPHGPDETLRKELVGLAKAEGLVSPHVDKAWGGLGLSHREKAVMFEAAGYSPLGPIALNCAAPDEGNMHLLQEVASEAQKERWLRPLAAGDIRSCFCMTEPGGAGSDPALMRSEAVEDGDDFIINGRKWLITGAVDAGFAIIMTKTNAAGVDEGAATMFLADMNMPGIVIERLIETNDNCFSGGHAVVAFENLRVPRGNVLGEVGEGFGYAQVRLAPARLTHCMRWLGAAERAHDIAAAYASRRTAFGKAIGAHEGVGFMLADNVMDLHTARLVIWQAAWLLDQGARGGHESSMAKVICSEAEFRIVDRAMQILGGLGVTTDTIVERLFREIRGFRIYDGPSEVHRWSIARRVMRRACTEDAAAHARAIGLPFAQEDDPSFLPAVGR
ncbi:MAG: acyl-CoA dehydrogenase family protein [Caulobacterales bacterium]|nr:acyl-CoA dehydrogenase family protein [Caulobacterales bacterium]